MTKISNFLNQFTKVLNISTQNNTRVIELGLFDKLNKLRVKTEVLKDNYQIY